MLDKSIAQASTARTPRGWDELCHSRQHKEASNLNKSIAGVCAHCAGHCEGGPVRNHHGKRDRCLGPLEPHSFCISIGVLGRRCTCHFEVGPGRNHRHKEGQRIACLREPHSSGISIGEACRRYTCHSEVGPCRNHRCKEGRRIACMCTCQSAARCAELCPTRGSLTRAKNETSTTTRTGMRVQIWMLVHEEKHIYTLGLESNTTMLGYAPHVHSAHHFP